MLGKIAPRYVIGGVIQNSYYAHHMAIELSKQIIGASAENFFLQDPKHYFECNFFGHLSTLQRPTQFIDQYEAEKYDQAVKKFRVYNDIKGIYDQLNEFTLQVRELYRLVETQNSSSNFFSKGALGRHTNQILEEDISCALERYHNLVNELKSYPEWKIKVEEQIGKWFHMIHNNIEESPAKAEIFAKLNRHEYFV